MTVLQLSEKLAAMCESKGVSNIPVLFQGCNDWTENVDFWMDVNDSGMITAIKIVGMES